MPPPRLAATIVADLLATEPLPAVAGLGPSAACHLVGGAVRDRVLGRTPRDLDLVVERGGRELARRLERRLGARRVDLGGERFASFRLVGPGWTLDLWDREGASLRSDLLRRDFTINSVAVALDGGRVADPLGGLGDLARRTLRANGGESFRGDPLRVLRLVRFADSDPPFRVEPRTLALARRDAAGIDGVAVERVRDELERILASATPRAVDLLGRIGLYPALWTGFARPPAEPWKAPPIAAFEALDAVLARWRGTPRQPPDGECGAARHALLLAALERAGALPADSLLRRLAKRGRIGRRRARRLAELLDAGTLPHRAAGRRRFLHRHGARWPLVAAVAAARDEGAGAAEREARLAALEALADAEPELLDLPRLLDGRDVERLTGIGPGPALGELLAALEAAQVEGRVRDRETAEALVRDLARDRS